MSIDPNTPQAQSLSHEEFVTRALAHIDHGYEVLPVGKGDDRGRFKAPWIARHHGYDHKGASRDEIAAWPALVAQQITNGKPGILSLGLVLPPDVVGIDVDAYDGKHGLETLQTWTDQYGPLPDTYIVTARFDGSGIRLYRKPPDWQAQESDGSGVEFIDHNHRYIIAPCCWHHSGYPYRLRTPQAKQRRSGIVVPPDQLPQLPNAYLDGLRRSTKAVGGRTASAVEIQAFANQHTENRAPSYLAAILRDYRADLGESLDNTHGPTFNTLCRIARESRAGAFSFKPAVRDVRRLADQHYQSRGRTFDKADFVRIVGDAIAAAQADNLEDLKARTFRDYGTDTRKADDDPFTQADTEDRIERKVAEALENEEIRRRVAERKPKAKIDVNAERVTDGLTFLTEDVQTASLWGHGSKVLWAPGEGLMIVGPQGTGKSTIAQQLCLARMKVREPELLGFEVASDERPILYLAMDRRAQIRRSLARMVDLDDARTRDRLAHQLIVWPGPPPLKANESPEAFCEWVRRRGCDPGLVVVDSLKDLLSGLTDDADGIGFNDAMQLVLHELGCDFVTLHHQRKATAENRKPNKLSDVYGNSWLTAGQGSVILLWGEAGSGTIEFNHLKQPQEKIEAFAIHHAHGAGSSSAVDVEGELLSHALAIGDWFSLSVIGPRVFKFRTDTPMDRAQRERISRCLKKLTEQANPLFEHKPGKRGGVGGGGTEAMWKLRQP